MKILAISGKGESGKDLSAQILKEKLESKNKKVLIFHYADYLKFICKQYFGWDGNKNEKGRTLLQWVGTEKVRVKDQSFWVRLAANFLNVFGDEYSYVLIPDCRFVDEIEYLKKYGYEVLSIRITRPNHQNKLTPEQRLHPSEISLDNYNFDRSIIVYEGIDNLIKCVDELIKKEDL